LLRSSGFKHKFLKHLLPLYVCILVVCSCSQRTEKVLPCLQSFSLSEAWSHHERCFWSTSTSFFWDPGAVTCIICFSKLSELLLTTCPKYVNFLAFTDSKEFLNTLALFNTQPIACFAVHDTCREHVNVRDHT